METKTIDENEYCYDVTRTVCTQMETTQSIEVCDVTFEQKEQTGTAKTVEVEFKKECETQMVTVCEQVRNFKWLHVTTGCFFSYQFSY